MVVRELGAALATLHPPMKMNLSSQSPGALQTVQDRHEVVHG